MGPNRAGSRPSWTMVRPMFGSLRLSGARPGPVRSLGEALADPGWIEEDEDEP